MITHNKVKFNRHQSALAYKIIESGIVINGDYTLELEKKWAKETESKDAAAVKSGVAALRLALIALDVSDDDEVIIPAYSCVALHNAVLSVGAKPVLADINLCDNTLDVKSVASKITDKTKAIIIVHIFGNHAPVFNFKSFDIPIIEDMAHGVFGLQGDLAISSFGPTKLISSISGGIVSGKQDLIDKVKDFRDYGDKDPSLRQNDVIDEVSAAIALDNLDSLQFTKMLREDAAINYDDLLQKADLGYLVNYFIQSPYRYIIDVEHAELTALDLLTVGVKAEQPVFDYRYMINWGNDLRNTEQAYQRNLSLPFWIDITEEEQNEVVIKLKEVLNGSELRMQLQ